MRARDDADAMRPAASSHAAVMNRLYSSPTVDGELQKREVALRDAEATSWRIPASLMSEKSA